MRKKLLYFVLALSVFSCSETDNKQIEVPDTPAVEGSDDDNDDNTEYIEHVKVTPIVVSEDEKEVVASYNKFTWKLIEKIVTNDPQSNHALSPASVSWALGMLASGAEGVTQSEILYALNVENVDIAQINSLNAKITSDLASVDPSMVVEVANSLWHSDAMTINESYKEALGNAYAAQVSVLDAESPEIKVNQWIEGKTHGLIKNLVGKNMLDGFALVNALYLRGSWAQGYKFDEKNTQKGYFHNGDGSKSTADFMVGKMDCFTYATDEYRYFRIPLGAETFDFNVILPYKSSSVAKCLEGLESFDSQTPEMKSFTLMLPKFGIDSKYDLVETLKSIGIYKAFANDSEFPAIALQPIKVNSMMHGANVMVDEAGIEGGSATAILGITGMLWPDCEEKEVTADRPFIYYITEHSTGVILFVGQVVSL